MPISPITLKYSPIKQRGFRIECVGPEPVAKAFRWSDGGKCDDLEGKAKILDIGSEPVIDGGSGSSSGSGGGGGSGDNGSGGSGGGDNEDGGRDHEEKEFGPLLKFEEVMREAEARKVKLPADMAEAAKATGIREMFVLRYLELQVRFEFSSFLVNELENYNF